MKALVVREPSVDDGTFGELTLENGWSCVTVEPPNPIPAGTYHAELYASAHVHRTVYLLQNVPGHTYIEIHNGNFAGDVAKGYQSQSKDCILVGRTVDNIERTDSDSGMTQRGVTRSRATLDDFMAQTGGDPLDIEIKWAQPR